MERKIEFWYGKCPNCGNAGKGSNRYYRKLDDRGFWVGYRVCKNCETLFDLYIEGDTGTEYWRAQQEEKMTPHLTNMINEMHQAHKLRRCY